MARPGVSIDTRRPPLWVGLDNTALCSFSEYSFFLAAGRRPNRILFDANYQIPHILLHF